MEMETDTPDVIMENDSNILSEEESEREEVTMNGRGWVIQSQHKVSNVRFSSLHSCYSKIKANWIYFELKSLLKLSIPITLALVFQTAIFMISLIFVGNIPNQGDDKSLQLDSFALSGTVINVTGVSIGIGLSTAADTLCSQAFGYKNYKRVGVIFQRGLLILLLTSFFIFWVWLNTESLLLLLQQPPCVAKLTGEIVQISCLGLPGAFLFVMLQKYLQTQGIVWPFIITGFISIVILVVLNALFIYAFHFGIIGVAVVFVLTNYIMPLLLALYIRIRKLHQLTWDGWSIECLKDWGQFYKLGLPGVGMVCMEWISFEISTLVLGTLGEVELAINAVLLNVITMLFMIPLGISIAVSIRVGNELGAGNPKGAKRASAVSIGLIIIVVLIISAILQGIGGNIGRLYNVEDAVFERLTDVTRLLGFLIITDQIQGVMSGVIRGAGHQLWGAIINFISFYIVGLPIGIPLSIATKLKSFGMWTGLLCASIVQVIGYSIAIGVLKWNKESQLAIQRASGRTSSDGDSAVIEERGKEKVEMISLKKYQPLEQQPEDEENSITVTNHHNDIEVLEESNDLINDNNIIDDDNSSLVSDKLLTTTSTDELTDSPPTTTTTSRVKWRLYVKFLLTHGSLYLIGIVGCIIAGIASMYHPPDWMINGNFTACEEESNMMFMEPSPTPFI